MKKLGFVLVNLLALLMISLAANVSITKANTYDLTTDYNLRIDGSYANQRIGFPYINLADIDNNGKDDFIIHSNTEHAIYVISDTKAMAAINAGQSIDISNSANYMFKIETIGAISFADVSNDGKLDVIVSVSSADSPGKSNNGEVYIYNNNTLNNLAAGTSFDSNDATKYSYVIRGVGDGDYFSASYPITTIDIGNDDKLDLVIAARGTDYVKSNGGSAYVIPNSVISGSSLGNVVEMSNSDNYLVRLDSGLVGSYGYGISMITSSPGPTDGQFFLIVGNIWLDNPLRYRAGTFYVVPSTLLGSGTGNTLDLSDSQNYSHMVVGPSSSSLISVRSTVNPDSTSFHEPGELIFTGSGTGYYLSNDFLTSRWAERGEVLDLANTDDYTGKLSTVTYLNSAADYSGDGQLDYMFSYTGADDNGTNTGSSYLINADKFASTVGSGLALDLQDSSNQMIKWMGDSSDEACCVSQHVSPAGDLNGDDKPDFFFLTDWTAYNGSRSGSSWLILNFPHTITLDDFDENTSNESPTITGSVSAPLSISTIGGVQWSLDNDPRGDWEECTADDGGFDSTSEEFSCKVDLGDEGDKRIYVRAYDENGSYTAVSHYARIGTEADRSAPAKTFTVVDEDGNEHEREFKQQTLLKQEVVGYNHNPQFCFTVAGDSGSGLKSYQLVIDGLSYLSDILASPPPAGDNGDTRKDGDNIIKENSMAWIMWQGFQKLKDVDQICVYGKGDDKFIPNGLHTWEVVAFDHAGNYTTIGREKFLIGTHSGSVGKNTGRFFPLSILQIGNRHNLNYSTENPELFTSETPALVVTDTTPTIYGIASVGSRITLKLESETGGVRSQVASEQTDVNANSEWGINLTETIPAGSYYLTIEAEDNNDNYAIVKDILIKIGASSIPVATPNTATKSAVLGQSIDMEDNQSSSSDQVQPTSSPMATTQPTSFAPAIEVTPQRNLHEIIFDAAADQVLKLIQ